MQRDDLLILVMGFQNDKHYQLSILKIWNEIIDNFKLYKLSKFVFISKGLDWFVEDNLKSENIKELFFNTLNKLSIYDIDIYICKTEADKRCINYVNSKLISKGLFEIWSFVIKFEVFIS